METEPIYDASEPLTYGTFYHAMEGFQRRHPAVNTLLQDCGEEFIDPVRFEGVLKNGMNFAISYSSGEEEYGEAVFSEGVGIGILLQRYATTPDTDVLDRQIVKMHHDIPGTEGFIMYGIPERSWYNIILKGELSFTDGHTAGDVDALFDRLCHAAPKVVGQFRLSYVLDNRPARGS